MSEIIPSNFNGKLPNILTRLDKTDRLHNYGNGVKRVIVKSDSNRSLENQTLGIKTNTFTTVRRNYEELFENVDFVEL